MLRQIVRVRWSGDANEVDLEVPEEVKACELSEMIAQALGWPSHGPDMSYEITTLPPGRALRADETLAQAGSWESTLLELRLVKAPKTPSDRLADGSAALFSDAGKRYVITVSNALIGRRPMPVNVDLSDEPRGLTVSREHARLINRGGQWWLTAAQAKTAESTLIDGKKLDYGQEYPLRDGSRLCFGQVALTFRLGKSA